MVYSEGSPHWAAVECLRIIERDRPLLERLDAYLSGVQDSPYMPDDADLEFKKMAGRAPLNFLPLVVNSVTQACYVDAVRYATSVNGGGVREETTLTPEMLSWQHNRMDARQLLISRALVNHGLVYVLTTVGNDGLAKYRAYTGLRACTLFNDPVNDDDPEWGLVVVRKSGSRWLRALLYSESDWWIVTPGKGDGEVSLEAMGEHGFSVCPLSRAALHLDLDGASSGLTLPLLEIQDQINQTSFDALIIQSHGSFKVRTVSGVPIPVKRWTLADIERAFPPLDPSAPDYEERMLERASVGVPNVGDPVLDENGQEIPIRTKIAPNRLMMAEDADTKFGTLPETNLGPILAALDQRVRFLAAVSQTPPTYFMGEMANLSAEALQAAEISKTRRDGEVRTVLAELYERMLRLGMEAENYLDRASDDTVEIVWADTDPRSLSQTADALSKMVESLEVPPYAAWEELPGMTAGKLSHWYALKREWEALHPSVSEVEKYSVDSVFEALDGAAE